MEILIKSSDEDLLHDLADNLNDVDYINYILSISTAKEVTIDKQPDVIIININ